MEFVELTKLLEKSIHQINELLPPDKQEFGKYLYDYHRVICQKATENTETLPDLRNKVELLQRREGQLRDQLEALYEHYMPEIIFRDEIISQNLSLIIQHQQQHNEELTRERNATQNEIVSRHKAFKKKEEQFYQQLIITLTKQLEKSRNDNTAFERQRRENWNKMKQTLDEILLKYDRQMFKLQSQLENINQQLESEKRELEEYKVKCTSQDMTYHELMKEKEEYHESLRQQKLYEIRVKMAKRTIVKFVEQYYPAWKKRKQKTMKKKSKYKYKK